MATSQFLFYYTSVLIVMHFWETLFWCAFTIHIFCYMDKSRKPQFGNPETRRFRYHLLYLDYYFVMMNKCSMDQRRYLIPMKELLFFILSAYILYVLYFYYYLKLLNLNNDPSIAITTSL